MTRETGMEPLIFYFFTGDLPMKSTNKLQASADSCTHKIRELHNGDLLLVASNFCQLQHLVLGHPKSPQEKITEDGISSYVKNFHNLRKLTLCCLSNLRDPGVLAVTQNCRHLTSLSLTSYRNMTDGALNVLSNYKSLKELQLTGIFMFTSFGLSKIGENCKGLLTVGLDFDSLDISLALKSIATNCHKLETLTLKFRSGDLRELSTLCSLICLHIKADNINNVDDEIINVSIANRNLKEFTFFNPFAPLGEVAAMAVINNYKTLEKFCIEAFNLSEPAVLCLIDCKNLNSVALNQFYSEGKSLAKLGQSGMLKLKEISVAFGSGIWDRNLEILIRANKGLEKISLQCCSGLSVRGFSAIVSYKNLQYLDISFTNIDNASLVAIENSASFLHHPSLVKFKSVRDMKVLSNFKALEYLNLDQCLFVSDKGLDFLAVGYSWLSDLSLASTRITNTGVSYLASCSVLRSLKIPYCRGVQGLDLVAITKSCCWLRYLVISHRFRDNEALVELKKQCCLTRLEIPKSWVAQITAATESMLTALLSFLSQ
ncbi:hypothetical protein KI387_013413 [Taxus chinensis]|uniref:F-box/LRR-repeat protein 15-like leucin rich repeat domain-containing protein n=1 Tax=Taxus chinensis TaxID=29808 RepID=A0AA38CJK0_TAXCH|nr:hypothetical protein KI387_013413 [Taxus chinensis]